MKNIILLLLTFLTFNCFAQFSKTHYIPPLSNSIAQAPQGQFMYISCPSLTPVNFKIFQIGSNTISGIVSRDLPYKFDIGFGENTQLLISSTDVSSVKSNKGFIVEAEDLVYVTVRLTATTQNFQAGGLVSKGLAALGTQFRVGAFTNKNIPNTSNTHYTFATILATENNTLITFGDIKTGVSLLNNAAAGNTPSSIILDRGQSFAFAAQGPLDANRDGLIGASITSNKPIAVNCGSFAGTNGDANNLDLGFDQLVSVERTGKEYIFIRGSGVDVVERPLIVANENGTEVFLNGSTTPFITLNSGEYAALNGSQFSANGNLFVKTSKNVFAFQGIGGTSSQANQNMHFLPPLSCETPKVINNIPFINEVGNLTSFTGTVCLVTQTGASLNFIINGINYTSATLPQTLNGPFPVVGNPNYVTYTVQGLNGNISVISTKQIYLSYYGSSSAATYGGFYSGFIYKPELTFSRISTTVENCIPNVKLSVSALSSFDSFKWYLNNVEITGANTNVYTPVVPGLYKVVATITECGTTLESDQIPVSSCPEDFDNDNTNNNIDFDLDNDGISNCVESFGNIPVDLSNNAAGTMAVSTYANAFTGTQTSVGTQPAVAFQGSATGDFITETTIGKGNSISQKLMFTNPVSLSINYPLTASTSDLLNANGEFILEAPVNKTITLLNPTGQLLVDTNYDGIYESGITNFSSFQIRFRLNGTTSLAAGTGNFKFSSYLINSIIFTHRNLTDSSGNKATFNLTATCIPKDSDGDSIADQLDLDSDNDGITDNREFLGQNHATIPFVDANKNGMNDVYEALVNLDSDADIVPNYLDLDSDNDGIFDLTESNSNALDTNFNGIIDGNLADFGLNGLANSVETTNNSGILNYTVANSDADIFQNYIDLDSDGDNCFDVTEAGFTDSDNDNRLGGSPIAVNGSGVVISGTDGYTSLSTQNYVIGAPIIITTPVADQTSCDLQNPIFTIVTNTVSGYQWQLSTDGVNFNNITNSILYSGVTTASLQITVATLAMNGYKYRVVLNKTGNSCGLISNAATLNMLIRPVVNEVTIIQCDDNLDGLSDFNLTQKNNIISTNASNETFTYYLNQLAANNANPLFLIPNPLQYNNSNGNTVWARVTNNVTNCFNVAKINLIVSITAIPAGTFWSFSKCDDYLNAANDDYDGISTFNFSSITAAINVLLPNTATYSVSYYKNEADFLAETDLAGNSLAITNISNYRNLGYADFQKIWIRVESTLDNSCFGFAYINLTVEKVPVANPIAFARVCDNFTSDTIVNYNFDTSNVQNTILNGQTGVTVTYFDGNNNPLPSPLPNPFLTGSQTIRVRVTNNSTLDPAGACFDETLIQFTVNAQPIATPITFAPKCDAILDDNNVTASFDTSNVQATLLAGQVYSVKYYSESGFLLSTPLPNPFVTSTQKIRVVIENPINLACNAEIFIQFTVNALPDVELIDEAILCTGQNNVPVTIDAGLQSGLISNFTYKWFKDGVEIVPAEINYTLTVNAIGNYSVLVKSNATLCERTRKVEVLYSEKAKIDIVIVTDLTDNNTVTVSVLTGLGDYEYSLNNPNGPFQSSGVFQNVPSGFHEVYVNDKKGCGVISKTISVLGAPQFFTPNGDGFNDFWKIDGSSATFFKNSIVYIFDKFGKLLHQIPNGQNNGWDGNYNGNPMPADDYWFTLEVDNSRNIKGHFALKR